MGQPEVPLLAFFGMFYMPFEFVTEMPDGGGYRPSGGISQRTDGITFYLSLDIPEQIDITQLPLPIFNFLQDLLHPARTLAAWRALSATLMSIKSRQGKRMSYHTLIFVQYDEAA